MNNDVQEGSEKAYFDIVYGKAIAPYRSHLAEVVCATLDPTLARLALLNIHELTLDQRTRLLTLIATQGDAHEAALTLLEVPV
jgi:hypothetical protein